MNKKADTTAADKASQNDDEKRQQVYQISANRGRAKHKMRYVERSLEDTGDCRLCVGAISPEDEDTEQS
ncbi:hypothetical protein [Pseudidiomarina donghaiensis]|uniref:Uncharacterized protein n=1 Tax=Pseudidiomarina donghaiensis TaxID=519452 RepID=A0A432XCV1_9GAMM|nr:hypothetical protein [Pseudidiomarina donghaiensis]RUO46500.1 hypothetical protein CWE24_11370 [Pseudidiomarina donghaiensis]SFV24676.1 hypothetical protein SAMN04488139_2395 [Pseudidiomarina donghaiensis]